MAAQEGRPNTLWWVVLCRDPPQGLPPLASPAVTAASAATPIRHRRHHHHRRRRIEAPALVREALAQTHIKRRGSRPVSLGMGLFKRQHRSQTATGRELYLLCTCARRERATYLVVPEIESPRR